PLRQRDRARGRRVRSRRRRGGSARKFLELLTLSDLSVIVRTLVPGIGPSWHAHAPAAGGISFSRSRSFQLPSAPVSPSTCAWHRQCTPVASGGDLLLYREDLSRGRVRRAWWSLARRLPCRERSNGLSSGMSR